MSTNKRVLIKGLSLLGWALPLFFIGPIIIHSSFKNQSHPFFVPVLGIGIIFCFTAILLLFKGLKTITDSLFDK